jgi:hypothetical protein
MTGPQRCVTQYQRDLVERTFEARPVNDLVPVD